MNGFYAYGSIIVEQRRPPEGYADRGAYLGSLVALWYTGAVRCDGSQGRGWLRSPPAGNLPRQLKQAVPAPWQCYTSYKGVTFLWKV